MSCQPHRVTSGRSNPGHKQMHMSKLFWRIYQPSVKSVYKTNHFTNITHTIHKRQTQTSDTNIRHKHQTQTSDTNFRRVSPFSITPVKRAHKARTCWYRQPFRLIYRYHVIRNRQIQYKHIFYINTYGQIPVPYGSKLHIPPTNYHLLSAQQEKDYLWAKILEKFLEKGQENRPYQKNDRKSKRTRQ